MKKKAKKFKTHLNKWAHDIIHSAGGKKTFDEREFVMYDDKEVGTVEWTLRCLGNPLCEGSQEVVDAILRRREAINKVNLTNQNPSDELPNNTTRKFK